MEYPPLVAGRTALFAVHLTRLADFTPVTPGRPASSSRPRAAAQPTALSGPPPSRPGAFRVEGRRPRPGAIAGRSSSTRRTCPIATSSGRITVFADEAGRRAPTPTSSRRTIPPRSPTSRNSSGPTSSRRRWCEEAELRTSIRVPATIDPLPGGEAIVVGARRRPVHAPRRCPSIGRSRPRRVRCSAAWSRGWPPATIARRSRPTVAEARAALEAARAELTRAERLLAERAVPARRVEDARRAVAVAEARLARPRRGWRSATRRCAPAAAPRPATPSSCARRSPAGRRGDGDARRLLRRRRAALPHRPHRSRGARGAGAGRRRAGGAATSRRWRSRSRACRTRSRSSRITCTTPASSIRRPARCPCRSRSPIRASSCSIGQAGTAVLYTRERSACPRCRQPPC